MMDLKDIIKWFIPCFHILVSVVTRRFGVKVMLILLLNYNNFSVANAVAVKTDSNYVSNFNLSDYSLVNANYTKNYTRQFGSIIASKNIANETRASDAIGGSRNATRLYPGTGRTFGRPMKKLAAALIPLSFQIGAASTWAVVAALVGLKTLAVAILILKLLLVAGAAKFGSLFSKLGHQHHESWTPPQKEVHLHIHNSPHGVQEPYGDWSRDGAVVPVGAVTPQIQNPHNPGPATINTPYGSYVRIGPPANLRKR